MNTQAGRLCFHTAEQNVCVRVRVDVYSGVRVSYGCREVCVTASVFLCHWREKFRASD